MSYGFLHGIEELGRRLGRDWHASDPQQDWKVVHFFGYDNSFYHAILYPVLYKLAFPGWEPDIDYHHNEFLLLDGEKFSTSRRHAIWGKEILGPHSVDAVRFYLAWIRPEEQRTNFEQSAYAETARAVLIDGWQGWLHDLGRRVEKRYSGTAPDAGIWTPDHTAFLARLGIRLEAVTAALRTDGFTLHQAAAELAGIVDDARAFSVREERLPGSVEWQDETRTAIALELAAAKLLAACAAPLMPRFATKLANALGEKTTNVWPRVVTLLDPGAAVTLAQHTFFTDPDETPGNEQSALSVADKALSASEPQSASKKLHGSHTESRRGTNTTQIRMSVSCGSRMESVATPPPVAHPGSDDSRSTGHGCVFLKDEHSGTFLVMRRRG